ncbi:DNA-deoxyinosine glycosylase [Dechloromonas agitata]|uniref:DNA-deoxyinosine glycosylase n=1 Tax=Dechloromonas agitata TaxID=73030 RepID=UPI00237E1A15|nr:DNA-deoxyinosine glycosylase [Dechloromonas agitata]MDE1546317.1 DNA-deoxyinosine glycosylase [Dechloromonas agitata]
MVTIRSFPPVAAPDARRLILGSMPGEASLSAGQYYAHPRNAFWRIMGDLLGAGPALPYPARLARLTAAGIALWDVVADCERRGSLDAAIVRESVQANDFRHFFAEHPGIEQIFFNGTAAENLFRRHVLPRLDGVPRELHRLPSTSPAHAARGYAEKLAAWSVIVAK